MEQMLVDGRENAQIDSVALRALKTSHELTTERGIARLDRRIDGLPSRISSSCMVYEVKDLVV